MTEKEYNSIHSVFNTFAFRIDRYWEKEKSKCAESVTTGYLYDIKWLAFEIAKRVEALHVEIEE